MIKHGHSSGAKVSTEYSSWQHMKARCNNPNFKQYPDYGGRGVTVHPNWLGENGFVNFLSDMGHKPSPEYSLDRFPDTNGNYTPSNCRWATEEQQKRNTRRNVWLEHDGIKMIVKDWAIRWGIDDDTILVHLKNGKDFEWIYNRFEVLVKNGIIAKGCNFKPIFCTTLNKKFESLKEACDELGIDQKNLSAVLHGRRNHTGGYRFKFAYNG